MRFKQAIIPKRVVVKVGTSSLTHPSGLISFEKVENIIRQLIELKNKGSEVILVSSGAIGAGKGKLKFDDPNASIAEKQALAAVGQTILMQLYSKFAAEYGATVGQILLSREDIADSKRGKYSRDALLTLLKMGIIPIVNENDAVATEEIKFGDNDRLSAMVCNLINAPYLVILSDIDGLYDDNPNKNPQAKLIPYVTTIDDNLNSFAKDSSSNLGTGGMKTKLMAAEIAQNGGAATIIAAAKEKNIVSRIFKGENIGTYFERKTND